MFEKNVELYNDDCVNIMNQMIEKGIKVDLVVTSPPYDNLRSYEEEVSWNFDKFKEVANKLYEVMADGGIIVWVVNDQVRNGSETGSSFKQALYFKEIGFNLHDTMIFQKANYIPLTHNRYEQSFEYMFCFTKGKPKTFNPIRIPCKNAGKVESYGSERRSLLDKNQAMRAPEGKTFMATKDTKYHPNIFTYTLGGQKTGHPATFPDKLAEDQIISWSNKGDLVFDPFMGSGTTGKMAILNDRKFIGVEIVKNYYDISMKRIGKELKNGDVYEKT